MYSSIYMILIAWPKRMTSMRFLLALVRYNHLLKHGPGGVQTTFIDLQGPITRPLGDRPLEDSCAKFRCFWPLKFCKKTLSSSGRAKGPLSPSEGATGIHFCKISKRWSKIVN